MLHAIHPVVISYSLHVEQLPLTKLVLDNHFSRRFDETCRPSSSGSKSSRAKPKIIHARRPASWFLTSGSCAIAP
jgi:hypothetical protein